jgi:hypothetical protein
MPCILQKSQNKKNKVHSQKKKTRQYRKQGSRSKFSNIINNLMHNGSNTPRTLF